MQSTRTDEQTGKEKTESELERERERVLSPSLTTLRPIFSVIVATTWSHAAQQTEVQRIHPQEKKKGNAYLAYVNAPFKKKKQEKKAGSRCSVS